MKYIKGYDSLRAISIMLVIITHLGLYEYLSSFFEVSNRVWRIICGDTGVQIFFTLSGFLITSILLNEKVKSGSIHFKNFYARRFLRLLPALLIFYIIIVPLMYFKAVPSNFWGLIYSFFYVYNFVPNQYFSLELSHMWSLALEEQFYLTWPLVIFLLKRRLSLTVFSIIIVVLCVVNYLILQDTSIAEEYRFNRWFIPGVGPIMIGSATAILKSKFNDAWQNKFEGNFKPIVLAMVLYLFPLYSPNLLLTSSPIFQAMGIGILLTWINYNQGTKVVNLLEFAPLRYIGRISYGLYIYQGIFLRTGPKGAAIAIQKFPLNLILTLVVAIISFEFIERRALRLKKHFH